ncbi:MAG: bis(5'-nucleosyl)-tetraphosphatase (symmetrical) YqeK [Chloroflexi bacterium]|nr:bis(5'-nucleosyl)-tetraphosphatase (symmetrical) YqeK [Chloroflexota bacterium]
MNDAEELLRAALLKVPAGLAEHVIRVLEEARRLAEIHGVDRHAVTIAALAHDLLRAHSDERLLTIAEEQGYELDPADRLAPILLHGPLAVPILQERYGIMDGDVLGAVAFHTTANEGMTPLQKVLFIADKIEPQKRERAAEVQRVAELAETDLDAAMLAYLDYHVRVALKSGWPLHSHTVAARNELLATHESGTHRRAAEAAEDSGQRTGDSGQYL